MLSVATNNHLNHSNSGRSRYVDVNSKFAEHAGYGNVKNWVVLDVKISCRLDDFWAEMTLCAKVLLQ